MQTSLKYFNKAVQTNLISSSLIKKPQTCYESVKSGEMTRANTCYMRGKRMLVTTKQRKNR